MQNKNGKDGPPIQKFRISAAERLSDILKPDVLDDETRKQIVRDVIRVPPLVCDDRRSPNALLPCKRLVQGGNHPAMLRDRVSSGNGDCLTAMAQRLKTLEAQLHAYREELKEKAEKLQRAEANFEEEKAKLEEAELIIVDLYDDKQELERQLGEMQKFLADYGLKWVGEKKEKRNKNGAAVLKEQVSASTANGTESPPLSTMNSEPFELYAGDYTHETPRVTRSSSLQRGQTNDAALQSYSQSGEVVTRVKNGFSSLPVSMDVLKRHAKILSDHVGSKGVVTIGKRGGIREREVVRIVVYQDGICVNGGLFRPFGWSLCDAVLNDIADGYYPYEFKHRYPDGFPIEIIDQTSVCSAAALNASNSNANMKDIKSVQEENDGGGYHAVSREEFLKRLPAARITTGGRIVSVQGKIASLIGVQPEKNILRHVSEAEQRARREKNSAVCQSSSDAMSTPHIKGFVAILVKYPSGEKVLLNLPQESNIAELRRELRLAVPSFKGAYDVRLSFPAVTYSDDSKTLKELGLLTNCTLMVQPQRHDMKK